MDMKSGYTARNRACCILVTGIPASGKSTMAAYLMRELGIPMLSKDEIKEKLFDTLGFSSREEKNRLGKAAAEMMFDFGARCLACGQSVILENNFEHASRPGLERMLASCDCRILTVVMTGDMRAIYERFVMRNRDPVRHRGHVVNDCYPEKTGVLTYPEPPAYEVFAESMQKRGMTQMPVESDCIVVDTTDFALVDMNAVARRVRDWMNNQI